LPQPQRPAALFKGLQARHLLFAHRPVHWRSHLSHMQDAAATLWHHMMQSSVL
jgi:hypothetical protein